LGGDLFGPTASRSTTPSRIVGVGTRRLTDELDRSSAAAAALVGGEEGDAGHDLNLRNTPASRSHCARTSRGVDRAALIAYALYIGLAERCGAMCALVVASSRRAVTHSAAVRKRHSARSQQW